MTEKTNGKLYITGEYQVLNKEGIAIVYGIPLFINFKITESNNFSYGNNGDTEVFKYENGVCIFENDNFLVHKTFEVVFEYLEYLKIEVKPFKLNIVSELVHKSGGKYGFGSSSAVISGVIKSVLNYHNYEYTLEELFKLSVYAQYHANEVTSGGDLAGSIYGDMIYYQRYNPKWVKKRLGNYHFINKKWPSLKLKPFETDILFGAIWTKTSYKTNSLTKVVTKKEYKEAKKLVRKSYLELIDNDYLSIKETIISYQNWFDKILLEDNLVTFEIKKSLEILNRFSLAGKISGAGGGDSVIFAYPKGYNFSNLEKELKNNNLKLILFRGEK